MSRRSISRRSKVARSQMSGGQTSRGQMAAVKCRAPSHDAIKRLVKADKIYYKILLNCHQI